MVIRLLICMINHWIRMFVFSIIGLLVNFGILFNLHKTDVLFFSGIKPQQTVFHKTRFTVRCHKSLTFQGGAGIHSLIQTVRHNI